MKFKLVVAILISQILFMSSIFAKENEYTKLRFDFSEKDGFNPDWNLIKERKLIIKAISENRYKETITLADKWLSKYPVDAEVYNICAISAHHLNRHIKKIQCKEKYYGLLSSIVSSGDGLTKETSFKVISIKEEYYLIDEYQGKLIKQSLVHSKDSVYDVMELELNGEQVKLYFDISIPLVSRQKRLNKIQKSGLNN